MMEHELKMKEKGENRLNGVKLDPDLMILTVEHSERCLLTLMTTQHLARIFSQAHQETKFCDIEILAE